jgi:membrane-associated phospholipid phosphatase
MLFPRDEIIKRWVVFISCFALFSLHATGQNWDVDLAKSINPRNPNSGYWRTTSYSAYVLGPGVPIALLLTGVIRRDTILIRQSRELVGSVLVELVISEGLKYAINRERPGDKYPGIIFPYSNTHGYSFPSGHSSLAFSLASGLSLVYRKWYITVPAYVWASTVGYSRIYLGVHYPSDVLAGAAIGIGSAWLSAWLNRKLFNRSYRGNSVGPDR